jgi:ketosteroid isomerase-like protein
MSQENVGIVRRAFAEVGESFTTTALGNVARAGFVAAEAELDFSAMYPDGLILRGLEAWRQYLDSLPWGLVKVIPERFFDVDDERVLVFVHVSAAGEGSGITVENRTAYLLTIRDDAIVRWKLYAERAEALEAAGLQE